MLPPAHARFLPVAAAWAGGARPHPHSPAATLPCQGRGLCGRLFVSAAHAHSRHSVATLFAGSFRELVCREVKKGGLAGDTTHGAHSDGSVVNFFHCCSVLGFDQASPPGGGEGLQSTVQSLPRCALLPQSDGGRPRRRPRAGCCRAANACSPAELDGRHRDYPGRLV